jgi:hypothetical protein
MLSVVFGKVHKQARYAECHFAVCNSAMGASEKISQFRMSPMSICNKTFFNEQKCIFLTLKKSLSNM